jgi:hypothetical protein
MQKASANDSQWWLENLQRFGVKTKGSSYQKLFTVGIIIGVLFAVILLVTAIA